MDTKYEETSQLKAIFESAVSPIITITSRGIIRSVNQATSKMFGFSEEELLGQNIKMLVPEPHKTHHDNYLSSYVNTGVKKIIGKGRELEAQRKDGTLLPIHLSVSEYRSGGEVFFVGIISDLTATKQAVAKTEAVIEAAVAPVITIDEKGQIESANKATTKMFGYEARELIGQNVRVLAPEPHRARHDGYLKSYRDTGKRKIIGTGRELEAVKKDGSKIPIHLSVSEFFVDQKRYFVGIISDLSAVKKAEAELREVNEQLSSRGWLQQGQVKLYEKLNQDEELEGIASYAINFLCEYLEIPLGILFQADESGSKLSFLAGHCTPKSMQGREFLKGEGVPGQVLENRTALKTYLTEEPLVLSTGAGEVELRCLQAYPVRSGRVMLGVMEFGTQVPLGKREQEFIESVLESIGLSIHVKTNEKQVRTLLVQTQTQAADLQAQQEELKSANEELQASEEELKSQQEELRTANEELQSQSQALKLEKTRLTEKTEELEEAQVLLEQRAHEVEEASRYKSEFLANMSHELRTPLNSILMLSQAMAENRKSNLSERQVSNLETIHSAGNDLLTLINDILDLSKVEAGKLEVDAEIFKLEDFSENIRNIIEPLTGKKNLKFSIEIDAGVPKTIETDRMRLDQIMRNLLSNAVKFTEKGSVTLKISPKGDDSIALSVIDTGIGIAEDKKEDVFKAFQQIDGKTTRQFGGTGLGLSITRELAALLGGEVTLESSPGKGSIFTLHLPLKFAERENKISLATQPLRKPIIEKPKPTTKNFPQNELKDDRDNIQLGDRVILVIEDDLSFNKLLYEVCHDHGFKALRAYDGLNGVRLAEEYRPLGILLDLSLPKLSGLEAIELLKLSPGTQHIPIQVISGKDMEQDSLKRGAIGYLQKPLAKDDLKDAFERLKTLSPKATRHLLIVEDDKTQRHAIHEMLEAHDLDISDAQDGGEALLCLEKRLPHCIILDYKLPDMNGAQFLEKAQKKFGKKLPPIIIYTGKELTDAELSTLESYSKSIIIKGAKSPERLVSETTLFLHRLEKNLSKEQKRALRDLRDPSRILGNKTIMVVDDDVRNRSSLQEVLEETGVNIITAKDGAEAVALYQKKRKDFDLILMDMMMPVMDGYEATRQVKKLDKKIPIIALTARAMLGEKEKCLAAGCDDYIAKPINTEQLLSLLRVWLYTVE